MRKPVYKIVNRDRNSFQVYGKAQLHYPKGKVVKAIPGSVGICCFRTKREARSWCGSGVLIRVEPINRGTSMGEKPRMDITLISYWLSVHRTLAKWQENVHWSYKFPAGTICYPAVRCID